MTAEIVWEDPSPARVPRGANGAWIDRLSPLMEHPKRWALVRKYGGTAAAYSAAQNLRRGTLQLPPGKWEFVGRKTDDGGALYARFLGDA